MAKTKKQAQLSATERIEISQKKRKERLEYLNGKLAEVENKSAELEEIVKQEELHGTAEGFANAREAVRKNADYITYYKSKIEQTEKPVLYDEDVKDVIKCLRQELEAMSDEKSREVLELVLKAREIAEAGRIESVAKNETLQELYFKSGQSVGYKFVDIVPLAQNLNVPIFINIADKLGIEHS